MNVLIIDYGMGNLGSISRFLQECGANVFISNDPKDLCSAEKIILPGVGSFGGGINNLRKLGFIDPLAIEVKKNKIPLLGICLGMQLLANVGTEGVVCKGLGFISGRVEKLEKQNEKESVPHVGWNEIHIKKESELFKNIPNKSDFYFVHSYHFVPANNNGILTVTPYCGQIISSVNCENIYGVQFHPEKSVPWGFELVKNFLNL
ncbi:imidazole glycerol phosphate synthase subunit HisH [Candidatus Dependentiae bacterium]|nr:imidazole glycerol phosphate synthase subunit HisH [Candidatus Dependentiae bacterium]